MHNQEAEGSGSNEKRTRAYIPREREDAEQRLMEDYFGDDENDPKYPEDNFRRRYRMSSRLFNRILFPSTFIFLDHVLMHAVVLVLVLF